MHVPVLLQEVIKFFEPKPGKRYIDATFGGGGHSFAIASRGAKVLGIDTDTSVIPAAVSEMKIVQENFAELKTIAEENDFVNVDGILFDLGIGSHQLDDEKRGFSFQKSGPLDMRYDQSAGKTAVEILNFQSEKELFRIFTKLGEEKRFGKRIARAVMDLRKTAQIETTDDLFQLIKRALPAKLRFAAADTARRIFMSLRIEVNQELVNLEKALPQALELLAENGRLAAISFHSLEDRIVKNFFTDEAKDCVCPPSFPICVCDKEARVRILTKKPITASPEEIKTNPRSRSAKLRVAEKI